MTSAVEWRTIPQWPYMLNSDLDDLQVWSMPRKVPAKGGAMRQIAGRRLKPTQDGRINLSHEGKVQMFHILRDLYPLTFPDHAERRRRAERQRPQYQCRHRHPLMERTDGGLCIKPMVSAWGTGNRICLWCHGELCEFSTNYYSPAVGVAKPPPDSRTSSLPAQPKRKEDPCERAAEFFAELYGDDEDAGGCGYLIMKTGPSGDFYIGVSPEG